MDGHLVLTLIFYETPLPDHLRTALLCHLCSLLWNFTDHHLPWPHTNSCPFPINTGDQALFPPDHHPSPLSSTWQDGFKCNSHDPHRRTLIGFTWLTSSLLPLYLKITLLTHWSQQDPAPLSFRRPWTTLSPVQTNETPFWQLHSTLLDHIWVSPPPPPVCFYPG